MIRLIVAFLLFCLLLYACRQPRYPGYTESESGFFFKIHSIGDGNKSPDDGSYLKVDVVVKTMDDSVLLRDPELIFQLNSLQSDVMQAAKIMVVGDSASFLFERYGDELGVGRVDSIMMVQVDVKLLQILSEEGCKQEIKYREWRQDREMEEHSKLVRFLEYHNVGKSNRVGDIYHVPLLPGTGMRALKGNHVFVHYVGRMLDSTEFDNTYKRGEPLDFILGYPGQVIKGLEMGIAQMREGGKSKFIIPSQLAFGEKGSSTGIVPAFTTVIYEVELVQVR